MNKIIEQLRNPSLALMEEVFGICGTELSTMQPSRKKIQEAREKLSKLADFLERPVVREHSHYSFDHDH